MTPGLQTSPADAAAAPQGKPVLEVRGLEVTFPAGGQRLKIVDGIDLTIHPGTVLGLVGESGSGKSMLARAVLGMVPYPGKVTAGTIAFEGRDLRGMAASQLQQLRGDRIAIVPQEPMTSLNPSFRIGNQLTEVLRVHRPRMNRSARIAQAVKMMELVGISYARDRLHQFPHELSGGLRQRVMIAMALLCDNVQLLIADEPTTALDVTIQAQILELFLRLQQSSRMAILLITHDLGVVAQTAHNVAVMYAGALVETAAVEPLFDQPLHPYTRGLIASLPRPGTIARKAHLPTIPGAVPRPSAVRVGCTFRDRCTFALDNPCATVRPVLEPAGPGRWVRCHRWRDIAAMTLVGPHR